MFNTPVHGNLGDQAIAYAEKEHFKKQGKQRHFLEVPNDIWRGFPNSVAALVHSEDTVCIHGGGNLGTLWPSEDDVNTDIISRFFKNEIIIYPQTCYYDNSPGARTRLERNRGVYSAAQNLTVMLRDKMSLDFFASSFPGVKAVLKPDIVLSVKNALKNIPERRDLVLFCFRTDLEKVVSDKLTDELKSQLSKNNIAFRETSTIVNKRITSRNRNRELNKIWRELAGCRLVVTDRLHGMIFAAITETPCIALDNVSGKVSGTFELIREELDFIRFIQKHDELIPTILQLAKKL